MNATRSQAISLCRELETQTMCFWRAAPEWNEPISSMTRRNTRPRCPICSTDEAQLLLLSESKQEAKDRSTATKTSRQVICGRRWQILPTPFAKPCQMRSLKHGSNLFAGKASDEASTKRWPHPHRGVSARVQRAHRTVYRAGHRSGL